MASQRPEHLKKGQLMELADANTAFEVDENGNSQVDCTFYTVDENAWPPAVVPETKKIALNSSVCGNLLDQLQNQRARLQKHLDDLDDQIAAAKAIRDKHEAAKVAGPKPKNPTE